MDTVRCVNLLKYSKKYDFFHMMDKGDFEYYVNENYNMNIKYDSNCQNFKYNGRKTTKNNIILIILNDNF